VGPATGATVGESLTGHIDEVLWVAFSPNGFMLASADYDATVRPWRLTDP
jgi:WD40 repeat protein